MSTYNRADELNKVKWLFMSTKKCSEELGGTEVLGDSGDDIPWTFRIQTFDKDWNETGSFIRVLSWKDLARYSSRVQAHIVLNATKLNGRARSEDMVGVRVWACDLDRVVDDIEGLIRDYKPNVVVESSRGKYHLYWKIDTDTKEISLEDWERGQKALAALLGGDPTLGNRTHQLRCPGFVRIDSRGEEWMPRVIHESRELFDIQSLCSESEGERYWRQWHKNIKRDYRNSLEGKQIQSPESGRHNFLYFSVLEHGFTYGEEKARDFGLSINEGFSEPLGERERDHAIEMALKLLEREKEKELGVLEDMGEEDVVNGEIVIDDKPKSRDKKLEIVSLFGGFEIGKRYEPYEYMVAQVKVTSDMMAMATERWGKYFKIIEGTSYVFDFFTKQWVERYSDVVGHLVDHMAKQVICDFVMKTEWPKKNVKRWVERMFGIGNVGALKGWMLSSLFSEEVNWRVFTEAKSIVGCLNGAWDMEKVELREVQAEDYLLGQSNFMVDVDRVENEATKIREILRDMYELSCKDVNEAIDFIFEVFGVSLSKQHTAEVFFHYGPGGNGKTTILDLMGELFGDYYKVSDSRFFFDQRVSGEYTMSGKRGKRLVTFAECDAGNEKEVFDTNKLKAMGEQRVEARSQYERKHTIVNQMVAHFTMNNIPPMSKFGHAVTRRVVMIPYRKVYVGGENFPEKYRGVQRTYEDLREIFFAEQSELLGELSRGYQRWLKRGCKFEVPQEFKLLQRTEFSEQNELGEFIRDIFEMSVDEKDWLEFTEIQNILTDEFGDNFKLLKIIQTPKLLVKELKGIFLEVQSVRVRKGEGKRVSRWSLKLKSDIE